MQWLLGGGFVACLPLIAWLTYKVVQSGPSVREANDRALASAKKQLEAEQKINTLQKQLDDANEAIATAQREKQNAVAAYDTCVLQLDNALVTNAPAVVETIRTAETPVAALAALNRVVSAALPGMPGAALKLDADAGKDH